MNVKQSKSSNDKTTKQSVSSNSSATNLEFFQKTKFKYNCSYCFKPFKYKSDAAFHVRSMHSTQTNQLMQGVKTETSSKSIGKYRCIFCLVIFRFKGDCIAHGKRSHNIHCPDCNLYVNKMEDLERHCKMVHKFDIYNSTMKYTSQGFESFAPMFSDEPQIEKTVTCRETVKCMVCSKYLSKKDVENHSLEHVISNFEWECKQCSSKFKNLDNYKIHMELHEQSEIALKQIATEVKMEAEEKRIAEIEHYKNLIVKKEAD